MTFPRNWQIMGLFWLPIRRIFFRCSMCFCSLTLNQRKSILHAMIIWIHTWVTHSVSMRSPQRARPWETHGRKPVSDLWDSMGLIIYGSTKEEFGGVRNLSKFGRAITRGEWLSQPSRQQKWRCLNQGLFRIEAIDMGLRIDFAQ
jgi:hypothetical protein